MLTIVKKNDSYDAITYQLENEDNSTVDLTGASVNFVMGKKNKLITNAKATVTSATSGIVSYQLTPSDTLVSGTFLAEFVVTFANGTTKTYPSNGYITVDVEQNLDTSQNNVVLDMIATKQGDFEAKLDSILKQGNGTTVSAMNEYTWTATSGQTIFVFPTNAKYDPSAKWFQVSVGNVPIANELINRASSSQFSLVVEPSLIVAGMTVHAMWVEPIVPITGGHHITHEINGQDEINIANLRNYQELVATPIASNTTALTDKATKTDLTNIATTKVNAMYPPSPYVGAKGDGITDDTTAIQNLLNTFQRVYLPQTNQFYKITSPLKVKDNYQIEGEGHLSQLKGFGSFNSLIQNFYGVTTSAQVIVKVMIKNLYLTKDVSSTVQFGIDTTNISYSVIDNIQINGFSDSGVLCNHTSANYNTLSNILTQNNVNDGIRLINNANSNRIYAITATNNGRNGIRIDDMGGTFPVETTEILGGSIEGSGQSGIHVGGRGVTISGMHIEGNSLNYAGYGISAPSNPLTSNVVVGCYFFNNGNDTNHISHVQGITLTTTVQSILAVYALGSTYMSYIRDGYLNMGSSGNVYVGDNTGMYNVSGEVWLQTSGSNKNLNIKGFGGFDAGIKLNGKVLYNADGSIVYAGRSTYFNTAMPTSGTFTQGDYCRNTVPTIQGTAPNRYIVKGWYRLTTGSSNVLNTDWWEERVSNGS